MKAHNKLHPVVMATTPLNGKAEVHVKLVPPRLNGSDGAGPASHYADELATIEARKQALIQAAEARERELADLAEAEKHTLLKRQVALKESKAELRSLANQYRAAAATQQDRHQADELLRWAMECEEEARQISIEGESEADDTQEIGQIVARSPWWADHRVWAGIGAAVGIVAVLMLCSTYFHMIREQILALNKTLPAEQQMQPYDQTSFQKLAYEKMVQFSDLPVALLMLLLVMPPVALYVLPFRRSRPDFWTEFKTELTPWQRCELASRFVLGFLLLAVLAHLVKV